MDEEVEDIVGDVKYTDSQKSMTTLAEYSLDFTDSSSDKNNSSGKDTYIIACDSDDGDKTFQLHKSESTINLMKTTNTLDDVKMNITNILEEDSKNCPANTIDWSASKSLHKCNVEIFTQTSKTIMELAQTDLQMNKHTDNLETQTSIISFTENKTVHYTIQVVDTKCKFNKQMKLSDQEMCNITQNTTLNNSQSLQDGSSECLDSEKACEDHSHCRHSSDEELIHLIEDDSKDNLLCNQKDIEYNSTEFNSDIEDDSLENIYQNNNESKANDSDTSEVPNSIDNDVEELYNKLSKSPLLLSPILSSEPIVRNFGILTPLTEETAQKKDSIVISPSEQTLTQNMDEETLFINNGVRIKMFSNFENDIEDNKLKLPPIINQSFPHNPHLNFIFSLQNQKAHLNPNEKQDDKSYDRWEICDKELASGESPLKTGKSVSIKSSKDPLRLPPIHLEGYFCNAVATNRSNIVTPNGQASCNESFDVISINGKIKELKLNTKRSRSKYGSRSVSPTSISSPEESRISDATERGCDALCCELLRKLRSSSWMEVTETLEDLPKALEKFWTTISESRIADLLRRVTGHIESPRTQVARSACNTLAEILKNTNYTKKPDFYEGISSLLTKTGSYNRPVRRAANVALDEIVCKVDITHAVTAICIYGVGHKNALVRSASARLLVVCCALAEGGRQILRARPPTAVAARKHALRSLAELLQDKNTETRKYAERLYAMLRPLQSFEAYFLADVDVELASRHMKKYDQLLLGNKQSR
ncbi:unnamed protein product, partial [Brenthis ino]